MILADKDTGRKAEEERASSGLEQNIALLPPWMRPARRQRVAKLRRGERTEAGLAMRASVMRRQSARRRAASQPRLRLARRASRRVARVVRRGARPRPQARGPDPAPPHGRRSGLASGAAS
jgi:hypothetical protein